MFKRAPNLQRGYKYCHRCESAKLDADFSRNRATPDGLASQCKPCAKARQTQSRINKLRVQAVVDYVTQRNGTAMIELQTVVLGMAL